jgi:hypothetical protein
VYLPEPVASSADQDPSTEALYDSDRAAQLVRPTEDGVQVFTVLESAAAPSALDYRLQLPVGWSASPADGGYDVTDGAGTVRYVIEAPWARDAAGLSVAARYALTGDILTLHVDHAGAAYPVVADPFLRIHDRHARRQIRLGEVNFWGRGYIASNCLTADVACESESGYFRAECTAQSKAMRSLARYNNRWAWLPSDRIMDNSHDPIDDLVQWEVGRYKGQEDQDCQAPESAPASDRTWRADIVVQALSMSDDVVTVLEVKEWRGPGTRDEVERQLDGYLDRFDELRASGGPLATTEVRLTSAGWAWCYQNNGKKLLGNRREYCAWADLPGHIYFSPVDKLSDSMLSDIRERFAETQEAERNADGSLIDDEPSDGDTTSPPWGCSPEGGWVCDYPPLT